MVCCSVARSSVYRFVCYCIDLDFLRCIWYSSSASQCITVHLVHGRVVFHKAEQSPRKRRAMESLETPPLPWQHLFSLKTKTKTKTNSVIATSSLISYDVDKGNGNDNEPLEKAEFCMAISLPHHNEILIEQFFVCANQWFEIIHQLQFLFGWAGFRKT